MENIFQTQTQTTTVKPADNVIIYWKPAGFEAVTSKNIDRKIMLAETVIATKKHNWNIIHDTGGLTFKMAKGPKYGNMKNSMMQFAEQDPRCARFVELIDQIATMGAVIEFTPGSAAERDIMPVMRKAAGIVTAPVTALKLNARGEELLAEQQALLADSVWGDRHHSRC